MMNRKKDSPAPVMSDKDKMIYTRQRELLHMNTAINAPDRPGRKRRVTDRLKVLERIQELNIEIDLIHQLK